ncbi:hypothetical protein EOD23_01490 [Mesorhizobium sp. USDA-HM6]|nr:hypothetical protein EOD23_01490 [Mesorhizobium sp. USDA-HM6]
MRIGIAPRLSACPVAARDRHRVEMGQTLVAAVIAQQELATSDRIVVAEAYTVEDHAKYRGRVESAPVLSYASGEVSVVMLDPEQSHAGLGWRGWQASL